MEQNSSDFLSQKEFILFPLCSLPKTRILKRFCWIDFRFWIISSYWTQHPKMQWATLWLAVCRNIRRCTHVWKIYICIYLHLHICKTPTKHVVKKRRNTYTKAYYFYFIYFIVPVWRRHNYSYTQPWLNKKWCILAPRNYPFCYTRSYCWQFIPWPLLFTGLVPISMKGSLSWIHVRQKSELKLLRLPWLA